MAAQIRPDHPKLPRQRLRLRVPHLQARPQRVQQHQRRSAGIAVDPHMHRQTVEIDEHHPLLPTAFLPSQC
jgi:hypothetical protein